MDMKKRVAKKSDLEDILETVIFIKDNMMMKSEGATKEELAELKQMVTGDIGRLETSTNARLRSLEKGQEKILETLEPLSRAHDKDSVTIVDHGKRITRIERHIGIK